MSLIPDITTLVSWASYLPRRALYGQSDLTGFARGVGELQESLRLDKVFAAHAAFDAYVKQHATGAGLFVNIPTPDGENVAQKLKVTTNPAVSAVNAALATALALHEQTTTAGTTFTAEIAAINVLLRDKTATFRPKDCIDRLHRVCSAAQEALKVQQAHEITALRELFADGNFQRNAAGAELFAAANQQQFDQVQQHMFEALQEKHTQELAAFEKSVQDALKEIHENAQQERDRVAYLANLYENNATMRAAIDALANQNQATTPGGGTSVEFAEGKAIFRGIHVKDISKLETITGRRIYHDEKSDTFEMRLPNRLTSSSYYKGSLNRMRADMISIAQAVKACGHPYITMSVAHKNPDHAKQLAVEAFNACREAGYDTANITIQMNGKKITEAELTQSAPSAMQAADRRAARNTALRKEKDPLEKADVARFKTTLAGYRARAAATAPDADATDAVVPAAATPGR